MKIILKSVLAATTFALMTSTVMAQSATTLDQLLEEVKNNRVSEAKLNKQREAEFTSARADKQALLRKAQSDLAAERARGDRSLLTTKRCFLKKNKS
jgi:biopolymer transport protein ExbB